MRRASALLLLFLFSYPPALLPQSTNASISGRVTDPSNALIADAKISAINTATNFRYESTTNNSGEYYLTNLPPGPYQIEIEKPGFKKLIKPDVILHVQDAHRTQFRTGLGSGTETITVEAGAPLLNTESAAVSTLIDHTFVDNFPLNGRSFQTLIHAHAGRGRDCHGLLRRGTIQCERATCGCQLFHRGRGQRQFRCQRLCSTDADR